MLLNRKIQHFLMQSLIVVLFAAAGPAVRAEEQMIMQNDEEDPCPVNAGTAAPADPDPQLCSTLPPDLARAAAEWERPDAPSIVNALNRSEGEANVPFGTKVKTKLFPFQDVSLLAKPNKSVKVKNFAGLLSFRTDKAGAYRFLLSQYAWLELIDASGQLAVVLDADLRLDNCTGMGRNVSFQLDANTRYWLQMSGVKNGAELELVISAPQ